VIHYRGQKIGWLVFSILLSFIILNGSCASIYHRVFMKGSIIETEDSEVFLCIGRKDGASVGQELNVYKITTFAIERKPEPTIKRFRREYTGKVKITEIIDEHFAKAIILSGKAEKNLSWSFLKISLKFEAGHKQHWDGDYQGAGVGDNQKNQEYPFISNRRLLRN